MSADGLNQTAVGYYNDGLDDIGIIYKTSDGGTTWTISFSSLSFITFKSVAMSADGTTQTVVSNQGKIWTSVDSGVTWTVLSSTSNTYWNSVAMSANGQLILSCLSGGKLYSYCYGLILMKKIRLK